MAKTRLIDADKLMERFRIVVQSGGPVMHHVSDICATIEDEAAEESEDSVPVIYCKDCVRRKKGYCTIRNDSWGATLLVGDHDFCSDAERRKDG